MRDWFRSTAAHNTVTVDGQQQSTTAGPFAWQHVAESTRSDLFDDGDFTYFEGSHNGYERLADPVTHHRALLMVKANGDEQPSYLIVRDRFNAKKSHRYEARYHFAAHCEAMAQANVVNATSAAGRLSIHTFATSAPSARVESGWVSRAYGERQAAPVAVIESKGAGKQILTSFIIPGSDSAPLLTGTTGATSDNCCPFRLASGETLDAIIVSDDARDVAGGQLAAHAEIVVARFVNERFTRACLVHGQRLEVKNVFALHASLPIQFAEVADEEGALEITIHGATRFELSLTQPPTSVAVNGARFTVSPECATVVFALEGSDWTLLNRN